MAYKAQTPQHPTAGSGRSVAICLAVAVLTLTLLTWLAWTSSRNFKQTVIASAQQRLLTIARLQADDMEHLLNDYDQHLNILANDIRIQDALIHDQSAQDVLNAAGFSPEIFIQSNSSEHGFDAVCCTDAAGIVQSIVPSQPGSIGTDLSAQVDIQTVLETRQPYISGIFDGAIKSPCITITYPIFSQKQFVGTVSGILSLQTINRKIASIQVGQHGHAQLFDQAGHVMAHRDPDLIGKDIIAERRRLFPDYDWSEMQAVMARMCRGQEGVGSYHSVWFDDNHRASSFVKKLIAFVPIRLNHELWSIGVTMDYDEISSPIAKFFTMIWGGTFLLIMLFAAMGVWFYRVQREKIRLRAVAQNCRRIGNAE